MDPEIPLDLSDQAYPPPKVFDPNARQPLIHLIRHGQALHNIDKNHPAPDPPLTSHGEEIAENIQIGVVPDLIILSPMTRVLQTAMIAFSDLIMVVPAKVEVQIWPDLREAHDALCNKGVSREAISRKFPQFDFSSCSKEWDYEAHSTETATARAESVRKRLQKLSETYDNIVVITHRGFAAFLVQGNTLGLCEHRSYRFAEDYEVELMRSGSHCESGEEQDFGPTTLVPCLR